MPKTSDLLSIATFRSMADAQRAKGILNAVGIDAVIRADTSRGTHRAFRGAELLVKRQDVHNASEALHRRHHGHNSD